MLDCPYPFCAGELGSNLAAFCPECRESIKSCANCNTANRALARYCRSCRSPLGGSEAIPKLELSDIGSFQRPTRVIRTGGQFWTAPIQSEGNLWAVSIEGDVWRIAPFQDQAQRLSRLPGEGGRVPSIIRRASLGEDSSGDLRRPLMFSINRSSVIAFDLVSRKPHVLYRAAEGEELAHSSAEDWVQPEYRDNSVYFLSRLGGRNRLTRVEIHTGDATRIDLGPAGRLVGPFLFDDGVGVYTRRELIQIQGENTRIHAFPKDFRAFDPTEGIWGLEAPFGSSVFVAARNSVYVPGILGERPGFLYIGPQGDSLQYIPIPLGEAGYAGDGTGRLLIARTGGIGVYEDGRRIRVIERPQLAPTGSPFVNGDFWVGHLRTSAKYEALLLSCRDRSQEFALRQLPGGESSLRTAALFSVNGALLFCYCDADNGLNVAVWEF